MSSSLDRCQQSISLYACTNRIGTHPSLSSRSSDEGAWWWSTHLTQFDRFEPSLTSLRSDISRMAVDGTPSASSSSRIFLRATMLPLSCRSRALYTTPYVPVAQSQRLPPLRTIFAGRKCNRVALQSSGCNRSYGRREVHQRAWHQARARSRRKHTLSSTSLTSRHAQYVVNLPSPTFSIFWSVNSVSHVASHVHRMSRPAGCRRAVAVDSRTTYIAP